MATFYWIYKLEIQNNEISKLKLAINSLQYQNQNAILIQNEKILKNYEYKKSIQYISEGIFYFVLILVIAFYIYKNIHTVWKYNERQKNILRALSHNLKTPLTILKLNLQTLFNRKLSETDISKVLLSSLSESHRLEILTNNILLSNEMLSEDSKLVLQHVDLMSILQKVIQSFQTHPDFQLVQYQSNSTHFMMQGEPLFLEILFNNLIDNAFKYGQNKTIKIIVNDIPTGFIEIEIQDEGVGILHKDLNLIFKKYSRIQTALSDTISGTGLGLFICKKIMLLHNASIQYRAMFLKVLFLN